MLGTSTNLTVDIIRESMTPFDEQYTRMYPFWGLGISCGTFVPDNTPTQMDLFDSAVKNVPGSVGA